MEDHKIKSIVADILGEKDSNMHELGHLRGIVVDINRKRIVCSGYEYTPIIKVKDDLKYDENDQIELYDTLGKKYIVKKNIAKYVPAFDVVTIRAFLYDGELQYSTHRKINIVGTKSRWGDSVSFEQMTIECKLPDRDTLFPDKTKKFSNYVYIFMIIHLGVANVSKVDIGKGYILYGGIKKMWEPLPTDTDVDFT